MKRKMLVFSAISVQSQKKSIFISQFFRQSNKTQSKNQDTLLHRFSQFMSNQVNILSLKYNDNNNNS